MSQQIIQNTHNFEYIMCDSDIKSFNLCTIDRPKISIKSYPVEFMQRLIVTNDDSIINNYNS